MDDSFNLQSRGLRRHQKVIKNAKQYQTLHFAVKRLVNFINSDVVLKGVIEELKAKTGDVENVKKAAHILVGSDEGHRSDEFEDELQFILRSYFVLEICSSGSVGIEHKAAEPLCREPSNEDERYEKFDLILLDPVIEYLFDKLDAQKYILANLIKYKQQVEWFERVDLKKQIENLGEKEKDKKRRIENLLNTRLYKYLHNQGVEFYIEPSSAQSRGEVDLISAQGNNPQLLLDGKYLGNQSTLKSSVIDAFNQVYTYTQQHNRPFGFIVLFKDVEPQLKFSFPSEEQGINYVKFNNKRIYFVLIDIYIYDKSPSQGGRMEIIEIPESDLTSSISKKD